MDHPQTYLFVRADGFVETVDGLFAVKMLVCSMATTERAYFSFQSSFTGPSVRVEWDPRYPLAVFPMEAVDSLLKKGYARQPSDMEVVEFLEMMENPPQNELSVEQAQLLDQAKGGGAENAPETAETGAPEAPPAANAEPPSTADASEPPAEEKAEGTEPPAENAMDAATEPTEEAEQTAGAPPPPAPPA